MLSGQCWEPSAAVAVCAPLATQQQVSSQSAKMAGHEADCAAEAAERVKVIQAEAEEFLSEIKKQTEIQTQQLEDERLKLQSSHRETIEEIQLELQGVRDQADERIQKIEAEMLADQDSFEQDLIEKSAERAAELKVIKEDVHEMSLLADEEYQKSLENEQLAHEKVRKDILDMEDQRSKKLEAMDQSCQLWIAAFNHRPFGTPGTFLDLFTCY